MFAPLRRVGNTNRIGHRLFTILLLGVVVSALSLTALVHLLSTTTRQRVERARDGVTETAERLAVDPSKITDPPTLGVVGMRGGVWDGAAAPPAMPEGWAGAVRAAANKAKISQDTAYIEAPIGDGTLVAAARSTAAGSFAWAAFLVRPLTTLRTWQWIVTLLAGATVLLVATTAYTIVTFHRGTGSLREALKALATDLSAPVPQTGVRELGYVAEGVARLAENLARARKEEERLARELSRQERLAALGRVAAGVAHEVRNPLASIKLRLDLALTESSVPPPVEKAIAHAISEIERLDRLVADLLIVAGRPAGPRQTTSMGTLVRSRVEMLAPWAAERQVALECEGDAFAPVDTDSVARALDNLLRNAVEASPAGARVQIAVNAGAGRVIVGIRDRGPGVSSERIAQLFEPFFTTKADGTGLGLALSRAIARGHGGDLIYVRRDGISLFELSIPVKNIEGSQGRLPALAAAPNQTEARP